MILVRIINKLIDGWDNNPFDCDSNFQYVIGVLISIQLRNKKLLIKNYSYNINIYFSIKKQ